MTRLRTLYGFPQESSRSQSGAFSLIELMLSMTIILIVVGMAAIGIIPALRKAAIQKAAQDIVTSADMARQLAMMDNGMSGKTFGVKLSVDADGIGTVQVVELSGSNVAVYMVQSTAGGKTGLVPYKEVRFPSSVILSLATADMTSAQPITWFYKPVIGDVRAQSGSSLSDHTVSVGMFVGGMNNVRDVRNTNVTGNLDLAPAATQDGVLNPGLVVRDPQNRYRQATTILNSGMAFATDCSE